MHDPLVDSKDVDAAGVEHAAALSDLSGCNGISLHCPLADETRDLVDDEFRGVFHLIAPA